MRDIKFRVWDKIQRKYYYSCDKTDNGAILVIHLDGRVECSDPASYHPEDFILEQYTGVKDKNGTEIYEGDFLVSECLDGIDPEDGHIVDKWEKEWRNDSPVEWSENYQTFTGLPDRESISIYHSKYVSVDGNIHEPNKSTEA